MRTRVWCTVDPGPEGRLILNPVEVEWIAVLPRRVEIADVRPARVKAEEARPRARRANWYFLKLA